MATYTKPKKTKKEKAQAKALRKPKNDTWGGGSAGIGGGSVGSAVGGSS